MLSCCNYRATTTLNPGRKKTSGSTDGLTRHSLVQSLLLTYSISNCKEYPAMVFEASQIFTTSQTEY
ncbi:hypothetical protein ACTXT7_016034 [Hymenolepis weldensis]